MYEKLSHSHFSAMAKGHANYGGYDYSFVDTNLDRYNCSVCTSVLKDPHLTGCCGQVFCESCLKYWFTKNGKVTSCPHCRAKGKEFQHFLDKRLKREIDSLKIYCTNEEEGCEWIGELRSLKNHLESDDGCGYVEVECPDGCCYTYYTYETASDDGSNIRYVRGIVSKMKRKDLDDHLKSKCSLRPCQCKYCGHKDTFMGITGKGHFYYEDRNCHFDECPEFPLECPNNCGEINIKRKDMEDHRSQCPEEPVQCPFEEAGCKVVMLVRRELEQHMSTTQQQHLLMVMEAYKEMKQANEEMRQDNQMMKKQVSTLTNRVDELEAQRRRRW